ncbi:MAG: FAD-binding oxidoreductase [Gammaproteobacteria bacterium]
MLALVVAASVFIYRFAAAPLGERPCIYTYPLRGDAAGLAVSYESLDGSTLTVLQRGGEINDASCLNRTPVYAVIEIRSEDDLRGALALARGNSLKVTPAGERHSMGGHSFSRGGLVLDMRGLDGIRVDRDAMTMTVGSGATWKEVQAVLDPMGLAVKAMQSINIFTVGGTLSVNAHGVAHDPGQIAPTVRSLRVMLTSGEVVAASATENPELFGAVLGGYGLAGIILDATLDIVPNDVYAWKTEYLDFGRFPDYFRRNVIGNPRVALMYARLSIAPDTYLAETAVHTYEHTDLDIPPEPLGPPAKVALKRLIFNVSKTGGIGRWIRWNVEKHLEPGVHTCVDVVDETGGKPAEVCVASRNQKMNQSMEYLDTRLDDTNILQEYFIPLDETPAFIDGLRRIVMDTDVNLVNVTLRIVTKDTVTALPYAKDDRIAFVLYFNQKLEDGDSRRLEQATRELIDLAIRHGGTFYLPYQLHYSPEQLRAAYPEVDRFFELKRRFDPAGLLSNAWYEKYGPQSAD